jgi:hypothetical protein
MGRIIVDHEPPTQMKAHTSLTKMKVERKDAEDLPEQVVVKELDQGVVQGGLDAMILVINSQTHLVYEATRNINTLVKKKVQ